MSRPDGRQWWTPLLVEWQNMRREKKWEMEWECECECGRSGWGGVEEEGACRLYRRVLVVQMGATADKGPVAGGGQGRVSL